MTTMPDHIDELFARNCVILHEDTARNIARFVHSLFEKSINSQRYSLENERLKYPSLVPTSERILAGTLSEQRNAVLMISALFGATPESFVGIGPLEPHDVEPESQEKKAIRFWNVRRAIMKMLKKAGKGEHE